MGLRLGGFLSKQEVSFESRKRSRKKLEKRKDREKRRAIVNFS